MGGKSSKSAKAVPSSKVRVSGDLLTIQNAQLRLLNKIHRNIKSIEGPMNNIKKELVELKKTNIKDIQSQLNNFENITKEYTNQSTLIGQKIKIVTGRYKSKEEINAEQEMEPGAPEKKKTKGGGRKRTKKRNTKRKKRNTKRKTRKSKPKQNGG